VAVAYELSSFAELMNVEAVPSSAGFDVPSTRPWLKDWNQR
jgi:hypothetical protein